MTVTNSFIELRLTRAYIRLFLVPEGDDGARSVSLARFGNYEVRLIEMSPASSASLAPLWMELYAHDLQACLDSCSCHEIEEAVTAAEQFIAQANQLNNGRVELHRPS